MRYKVIVQELSGGWSVVLDTDNECDAREVYETYKDVVPCGVKVSMEESKQDNTQV